MDWACYAQGMRDLERLEIMLQVLLAAVIMARIAEDICARWKTNEASS